MQPVTYDTFNLFSRYIFNFNFLVVKISKVQKEYRIKSKKDFLLPQPHDILPRGN